MTMTTPPACRPLLDVEDACPFGSNTAHRVAQPILSSSLMGVRRVGT
jgi:hypothetical protein